MKYLFSIITLSLLFFWGCNQVEETEIVVTVNVQDNCADISKNKISPDIYELYYIYETQCNKTLVPVAQIQNVNNPSSLQNFQPTDDEITKFDKLLDTYSAKDIQKDRMEFFSKEISLNDELLVGGSTIDKAAFEALVKDNSKYPIFYNTTNSENVMLDGKIYPVYSSVAEVKNVIKEQYCNKNKDDFVVFYNFDNTLFDAPMQPDTSVRNTAPADTVFIRDTVTVKEKVVVEKRVVVEKDSKNTTKLTKSLIGEYEEKLAYIKKQVGSMDSDDTIQYKVDLEVCEMLFAQAKKSNKLQKRTKTEIDKLYEKVKN